MNNGLFVTDYNTLCANSWSILRDVNKRIDVKNSEKKSIANKNKECVIKTKDLNSLFVLNNHSLLKRLINKLKDLKNEYNTI